jgi:tetratricopeptide (TPR) repeat protein
VARAVAALRAAADERARQAELERVRAEAETREQRKRRRVQLALAAAVGLLLLGGGAFAWWQQQQATERSTERRLNEVANRQAAALALDQAEAALKKDNPLYGEIDAALAQAERRLEGSGAADLHERLATAQAARLLLQRLDDSADLRWTPREKWDSAGVGAGYAEAFRQAGLDLERDPAELAADIRRSLIAKRLEAALDEWLEVDTNTRPDAAQTSKVLVQLLALLDPDPERSAVRAAFARYDLAAVKKLVAGLEGRTLPPSFAILVSQSNLANLAVGLSLEQRLGHVRRAQQAAPSHFGLALTAAFCFQRSVAEERFTFLRIALALRPGAAMPHHSLACALLDKGDLDGAVAEFTEALRIESRYADAYHGLGAALSRKNDRKGAIAAYEAALRINPKHQVRYSLAFARRNEGDLDGAIAEYKEYLRSSPRDFSAYAGLESFLGQRGDLDAVVPFYREVIRLHPKDYRPSERLARFLRERGDLDGAVAVLQEAVRLDQFPVYGALSAVLQEKGDVDGAIAAAREIVRLKPDFSGWHDVLGMLLWEKGDLDGAADAFRVALRLSPKQTSYQADLALTERLRGLLPRLDDVLAGRAEPKSPAEAAEFALLGSRAFQGRYAAAFRLYEKAFAADPRLIDGPTERHVDHAIGAAVLAAAGRGDGATLKPTERSALRARVLPWLQIELAVLQKQVESTDVYNAYTIRWLEHSGLAVTRSGASREDWPAAEVATWDRFWADFRAARARASNPAFVFPRIEEVVDRLTPREGGKHWALVDYRLRWLLANKDPAEKKKVYEEALTLCQKLVAEFPDERRYRHELATGHNYLGLMLRGQRDFVGARRAHEQAIALSAKVAEDVPDVPAFRQELAAGYSHLAQALRDQGEGAAAKQNLERALAIRQKLADELPDVLDRQAELADTFYQLGELLRAAKGHTKALAQYERCMALLRGVLTKAPNARVRTELRNAYWGRAHVLDEFGRYAEALAAWGEVLKLDNGSDRATIEQYRRPVEIKEALTRDLIWPLLWGRPLP